MKRTDKLKKKISNFFYDHYYLKEFLEHCKYLFLSLLAATIFAFGFTCFISPNGQGLTIATGGVSGLSQIVAQIFKLAGHELSHNVVQAIGYSVFNLPLLILSFLKIGRKFSMYTLINVIVTSILIVIFSAEGGIAEKVATVSVVAESSGENVLLIDSIIVRVLFASFCTGISSALAFVGDFSCGGIDIVTYYLGMRSGKQIGKYGIAINICVVTLYSFLVMIENPAQLWATGLISLLYSGLYLLVVALVIDVINLRNKKVQLQIVTKQQNMGQLLISIFPHGATMTNAKGVYSNGDEFIFLMVVSTNEYKKIIKVAKKIDPHAFISTFSLMSLNGNFFSKPVE